MSAKKMILILGGLVVVFFLATGWGQMSGGNSVGPVAESVMRMLKLVKSSERLEPSDVRSGCFGRLQSVTLGEGESCRLQVRPNDDAKPVRALELRLEQGTEVLVKTRDGSQTLHRDTPNKQKLTVQFPRESGELTLEAVDCRNQCEITGS